MYILKSLLYPNFYIVFIFHFEAVSVILEWSSANMLTEI